MSSSTTKRMSVDEKRKVILDIYHKTKAVYTEKEIISLSTKAGVNTNTVVDINQALVDDGLVDKEKIGGANYYWSFPAKKDRLQQIRHETTLAHISTLEQELIDAKTALMEAQRGREDDDTGTDGDNNIETTTGSSKNSGSINDMMEGNVNTEENATADEGTLDVEASSSNEPVTKKPKIMSRQEKLQHLQQMGQEKIKMMNELETLKENDPLAIANLQQELSFVHQAANRWTDNIYNCQTYLMKKRGMNKKETYKLLGITDSFDYPEDKMPK